MFENVGDFEKLVLLIGYHFKNKKLLSQATITSSAFQQSLHKSTIGTHQERLSFLGDSVLRLAINDILMQKYPYYSVAQLSQLRDKLVDNVNLAGAARKMGLEKYVRMDYNQKIQVEKNTNFKILADSLEAIIGAIYEDSDKSLKFVKDFILNNSHISDLLQQDEIKNHEFNLPLFEAISEGNVNRVSELIKQGCNTNAVLVSHEDVVRGNDLYSERVSNTPLSLAIHCLEKLVCRSRNTDKMISIIEILFQYGADPNFNAEDEQSLAFRLISPLTQDGHHLNPLAMKFFAFPNSEKDFIKDSGVEESKLPEWNIVTDKIMTLFFKSGFDFASFNDSYSPLALAAVFNDQRKLDLFFQLGADVNQPQNREEYLLHIAAESSAVDLVRYLLSKGAKALIRNRSAETPFDVATRDEIKIILFNAEMKEHRTKIVKTANVDTSMQRQEAVEKYNKAIKYKLSDLLTEVIQLFKGILENDLNNLNINDKVLIMDYYNLGSAYFHAEAYEQAVPLLKRAYTCCLINKGANDPDTLAKLTRLKEAEKLFKEYGDKQIQRKVQKPSVESFTMFSDKQNNATRSLYEAITAYGLTRRHVNSVNNLLKNGTNPNFKAGNEDRTMLHYAIYAYGNARSNAASMADVAADLGITSPFGDSSDYGMEIIELLLKYGANPNLQDENGKTPLHLAASLGHTNIVEKLIKYHANLEIEDRSHYLPAHVAKDKYTKNVILKALQIPKESTRLDSKSEYLTLNI